MLRVYRVEVSKSSIGSNSEKMHCMPCIRPASINCRCAVIKQATLVIHASARNVSIVRYDGEFRRLPKRRTVQWIVILRSVCRALHSREIVSDSSRTANAAKNIPFHWNNVNFGKMHSTSCSTETINILVTAEVPMRTALDTQTEAINKDRK